jgi:Domain of unknown function (DUF4386)
MNLRKIAIVAGVCFLISDILSIVAVLLYRPVLSNANWIVGTGSSSGVFLGAFFELLTAFAIIGTAVFLYPVVRKQNEGMALAYVGLRTLEAGMILVGVVSLLAMVTLQKPGITGSSEGTLVTVGSALLAVHNWTFLFGPGFTSGLDTVFLAYLLYKSGLVPRWIPVLGMVGGPLVFASATAVLFGLYGMFAPAAVIAALPELVWELSLVTYLIVKGFKPSSILFGDRGLNQSASVLVAPTV